MPEIRVLIADDHTILREGLKALFASTSDIKVVGEAANGLEAVDLARSLAPDVVLMDIAMPGLGGLEATVRIHKEYPKVKVLVLTQYDDKEYLLRLLRAGASGYVLKMAPARNLMAAVRLVHEGEEWLPLPDEPPPELPKTAQVVERRTVALQEGVDVEVVAYKGPGAQPYYRLLWDQGEVRIMLAAALPYEDLVRMVRSMHPLPSY